MARNKISYYPSRRRPSAWCICVAPPHASMPSQSLRTATPGKPSALCTIVFAHRSHLLIFNNMHARGDRNRAQRALTSKHQSRYILTRVFQLASPSCDAQDPSVPSTPSANRSLKNLTEVRNTVASTMPQPKASLTLAPKCRHHRNEAVYLSCGPHSRILRHTRCPLGSPSLATCKNA